MSALDGFQIPGHGYSKLKRSKLGLKFRHQHFYVQVAQGLVNRSSRECEGQIELHVC